MGESGAVDGGWRLLAALLQAMWAMGAYGVGMFLALVNEVGRRRPWAGTLLAALPVPGCVAWRCWASGWRWRWQGGGR